MRLASIPARLLRPGFARSDFTPARACSLGPATLPVFLASVGMKHLVYLDAESARQLLDLISRYRAFFALHTAYVGTIHFRRPGEVDLSVAERVPHHTDIFGKDR